MSLGVPIFRAMARLSLPRFYETTVHQFLRYLDSRIEDKESVLRGCSERHRPLIKTEIAELHVVRLRLEDMLGVPSDLPRHTYIVMADCGVGEFLWYRRSTYPEGYRTMAGSLMQVGDGNERMSRDLFEEFCQWARWYMAWDWERQSARMDWDRFNAEGVRLAERLKAEAGPLVKVMYCRAYPDPYDGPDHCVEILDPK